MSLSCSNLSTPTFNDVSTNPAISALIAMTPLGNNSRKSMIRLVDSTVNTSLSVSASLLHRIYTFLSFDTFSLRIRSFACVISSSKALSIPSGIKTTACASLGIALSFSPPSSSAIWIFTLACTNFNVLPINLIALACPLSISVPECPPTRPPTSIL